jgi:protein-S-isoprenylcysteine O-methyltransferase Ste14
MRLLASVLIGLLFVLGVFFPVFAIQRLWPPVFDASTAAMASFMVLYAVEKLAVMYFVVRRHYEPDIDRGMSSVLTGYAFMAIPYTVAIEAPFRRAPVDLLSLVGVVAVVLAVALRYWALRCLRTSRLQQSPRLCTQGPFGFVRHPIYSGACLEAIAIPLAFHSWYALVPALAAFIPLEIRRAVQEEGMLARRFGDAYTRYAERTPMFLPWRFSSRQDSDDEACRR